MKKDCVSRAVPSFVEGLLIPFPPIPILVFGHLLWILDVRTLYQTGYAYPFRVASEPTMVNLFGQSWDFLL